MQYCPFCRLEIPNNARFCARCGYIPQAGAPVNVGFPLGGNIQTQAASSIVANPEKPIVRGEEREGRRLFRPAQPFQDMPIEQASFSQTASPISPVYQSAMVQPPVLPLHTTYSEIRAKKPRGFTEKLVSGALGKWLLIAFIGSIIVAASATAIVFMVHQRLPIESKISTSGASGNGSSHALVNLTFSGAATNHMSTEALITLCKYNSYNGTKAYYFNVNNTIGGKRFDFFVSIFPFKGPGTYTGSNVAAHIYYQTTPHSNTEWNVKSPYIFKITGNSSLTTQGTVDALLFDNKDPNSRVHVSGNWQCNG